jgi:hypothetical protein
MDAREAAWKRRILQSFNTESPPPPAVSSLPQKSSQEYLLLEQRNPLLWGNWAPVMIRAAISADHLISPYFFLNGSVNHVAYLNMLQVWFIPQLGVREFLNQYASCSKMVYRQSMLSQFENISVTHAVNVPPRSPDLTTYDIIHFGAL